VIQKEITQAASKRRDETGRLYYKALHKLSHLREVLTLLEDPHSHLEYIFFQELPVKKLLQHHMTVST
jgi:hypothetical protein